MYDQKKKFRRSAVTTICYVLAALMLIYTCYQIGSTVHTINEYYGQYGMQATAVEYLTYTAQAALTPLFNTIVLFMLARILDEVRKNNPANYRSDEDIVESGIAKKEAKDAKKFEKGEKAAAKAAEKNGAKAVSKADEDAPVVADFTTSEAKDEPAEKKSTAKKTTAKKTADGKAELKKAAAKKPASRKKSAPKKTETEKEQEKTEE